MADHQDRRVVLVLGPPGSGKSTFARSLGLPVFDLDDERWRGNDFRFRQAVETAALAPAAKCVVIRTGATATARAAARRLCDPTEVVVMDTDEAVCVERVRRRGRAPIDFQLNGIRDWFASDRSDLSDAVDGGSYGDVVAAPVVHPPRLPVPSKPATTVSRGYGVEHRALRQRWSDLLAAGQTVPCACEHRDCPHHAGPCLTVITSATPWDLGHTDDRRDWTGPECVPCNRSAGARAARAASQVQPMTIREWCEPIANRR
ncbi:AAA family ATPase [Nakamurella flava]|uniref:AAA family ATPase n=1 Tax=Nakamurella flava TaxID=2576308 RepID=UPI00197C6E32|nr:AAA family ATPase [Nakamurella flava]